MTTPAKALAFGVLVALVGGCGSPSSHEPLTSSEYRKEANALCAGEARAIAGAPEPKGPDDLAQWIEAAYDRRRPWALRRKRLEPPQTLAGVHDRATILSDRDGIATDRLVAELRNSDEPIVTLERFLREPDRPAEELESIYSELGLSECADLFSSHEREGPEACREIVSAIRDT